MSVFVFNVQCRVKYTNNRIAEYSQLFAFFKVEFSTLYKYREAKFTK